MTHPAPGADTAQSADKPKPFQILLRGIHEPEVNGKTISGLTVADTLAMALAADVTSISEPLLLWKSEDALVALDFDRADDSEPLVDADIDGFITPNAPTPAAVWVTHGGGLRVLFHELEGISAVALAGVWLMLAPLGELRSWSLEVKTDTRHPLGLRDGVRCGRVFTYAPTADINLCGGDNG